MFDKLTENELLGWIEGDLTPGDAARVHKVIGSHPAAIEVLERLRRDKALMQADPEPVLTIDLVSELEPILAKPMLLGAPPSAARAGYRNVHRRTHVRRWSRTLLAAGFVIVVTGTGIAMLLNLIQPSQGDADSSIAGANGEEASGTSELNASPGAAQQSYAQLTDSHSDVHHWDAAPPTSDVMVAQGPDRADPASTRIALRNGAEAIESPFAITIEATEREALISRLTTMVADMGESALVRNFSYEDARARWSEMVATANVAERDRLMKSLGGGDGMLTDSQKTDVRLVAGNAGSLLGENLAGPTDLAAKPEHQLRLSESGAALSITLRAPDLLPVVEELHRWFGESIALRPLGAEEGSQSPAASDDWARWRAWHDAIRSVRGDLGSVAEGSALHVVIPITIE